MGEFGQGRTGIGDSLPEGEAGLGTAGGIVESPVDSEGKADGGLGGEAAFEAKASLGFTEEQEGSEKQAEKEGEDLVGHGLGDVGEGTGGEHGPEGEGTGGGDVAREPVADGVEQPITPVQTAIEGRDGVGGKVAEGGRGVRGSRRGPGLGGMDADVLNHGVQRGRG